jgi:hypothetical protein
VPGLNHLTPGSSARAGRSACRGDGRPVRRRLGPRIGLLRSSTIVRAACEPDVARPRHTAAIGPGRIAESAGSFRRRA